LFRGVDSSGYEARAEEWMLKIRRKSERIMGMLAHVIRTNI
jgi:hypothetical protein